MGTSSTGFNLMHVAASKGWQDVVVSLNEADASLKDGQSDFGTTPVMTAAVAKKTGIAKYLLEQGADPTIMTDAGSNLLHFACTHGVLQVVKMLIEDHEMDVNAVGSDRDTPLKKARKKEMLHSSDCWKAMVQNEDQF